MPYALVNGLQLYYETRGSGRPLVLLHGGLMTIDLNWGPLLDPLALSRQVIAVELQGHGHTADTDRAMTIEALAADVVALLDHLSIGEADLFGFSLGGLVAFAVALGSPARVGKLIAASADPHRPPGRESTPLGDDRMPTPADFQEMRDAYAAVAPDPAVPRRRLTGGERVRNLCSTRPVGAGRARTSQAMRGRRRVGASLWSAGNWSPGLEVAPDCDGTPDGFDHPEWPGATQKSVAGRQGAASSESHHKRSVSTFEGVHQHHERQNNHPVDRQHTATLGADPIRPVRTVRLTPARAHIVKEPDA